MNLLASVSVLAILIFFHEAGHFLAATVQGIRVSGFSIGFGPALLKKEFQGVTYSIRALPLGGFVSFPDDDDDSEIARDDPDLLSNRPVLQRLFVISAGVIANLLIAWFVLFGQATFAGLPSQPDPGVLIVDVQQNQAAAMSGLHAGDKIFGINGIPLGTGQDAVKILVDEIQASPGQLISLQKSTNGIKEIIKITPTDYQGKGKVGAQLQPNMESNLRPAKGFGEVLNYTNLKFSNILIKTIQGYKSLFTDFSATSKQLSGPVKIVELGAQLSGQGSQGLILFAALISINLAVLNSLPFPLLDGGQFTLIIIEAIRGRPIPEKVQLVFMQSGFVLLVGLSILLIIRDTSQLEIFQQMTNR
ncbi:MULTISPECIES: RIP metalloprotease RseP [unclassified Prochlorococcus]|uniref:RIP metalloprotease RseP n=1 Tax=unclassified Prochlorococcus TaxID=2627481 RepID=UPI000533ADED|nr:MULTISPECIES: RIP metalloprotease RseP [unclassified Prochlorococcus]KGG16365.1 Membrane-associated zinc metalloprotease [Prochlorococcus sp. MIT 0603]KGG17901.1 Membrane-associated zinc metalloprotease [Prochlorococcus sp. MIT 0602]